MMAVTVLLGGDNVFIILALLPATTVLSGTSLVTTEAAPTMAFFPMVTPGSIIAPAPTTHLV